LLTFCPPDPDERSKDSSSSDSFNEEKGSIRRELEARSGKNHAKRRRSKKMKKSIDAG
jgi:hypothetical protein